LKDAVHRTAPKTALQRIQSSLNESYGKSAVMGCGEFPTVEIRKYHAFLLLGFCQSVTHHVYLFVDS